MNKDHKDQHGRTIWVGENAPISNTTGYVFNAAGRRVEVNLPPMTYQQRIKALAPTYNAAHVEAYMRLERGTLDSLTAQQFAREVRMACACIDADPCMASRLAASFGL
jgi:hypothetical protein